MHLWITGGFVVICGSLNYEECNISMVFVGGVRASTRGSMPS